MTGRTAEPLLSRFRDDLDFRELLEEFVASAPERQGLLQAAFAEGSTQELGRLAHQLKGAGGGYGFDALSQSAAQLETACRNPEPDIDEIGPLLEEVVDHLLRLAV